MEFAGNFFLMHRADEHVLGKVHDVARFDGPCRLQCCGGVVQHVPDFHLFFDGVDAHACLDANIHGLGALAKGQLADAELGNEAFLAFFFD